MAKTPPKNPPAPPAPPPRTYEASIACEPDTLPDAVVEAALLLQKNLKREIWFMSEGPDYLLMPWMYYQFRQQKSEMAGKDVALVLDSFGGSALAAYRIATLFQQNAKSFVVVVPRIAKSAATLLALGAKQIILGQDAELGPLDVQIQDYDTEERRVSALDMVQAIEQLEESAIDVAMRMLKSLRERTRKRVNLLLDPSLRFAAEVTKPLFEKIDAVSYSRHHRMLKEAEDYAVRLLARRGFSRAESQAIARDLVKEYSTHEFVIDTEECKQLGIIRDDEGKETKRVGLHVIPPANSEVSTAMEMFYTSLGATTALGKLTEK